MLLASVLRARIRPATLVLVIVAGMLNALPASAAPTGTADPDLSTRIDYSGTGTLVTKVRTAELRAAAPAGSPRILVIGTGVQRSLFPAELQTSISGANGASDLTDGHGYGTIATATAMQLLPSVNIVSYKVRSHNAGWDLARMDELSAALAHARANASKYHAVLLAFPPQAALDPVSHVIGHVDHGSFGKGMNLIVEAMLSTRQLGSGPMAGIPTARSLRDAVFARANLRQRDAVEVFVKQATGYRSVVEQVDALDAAGVPIVAPSGDYTRKSGSTVVPLPTQTVFGLSALPSVITVGASYLDGTTNRVSPTSGRGPTLGLAQKPDVLAPADMLTLLPENASLPWSDDSGRAPLEMLRWARAGATPTPCPSVTGTYRCVLQGSTMVSASVVAANVAATAAGFAQRASTDDEALRGMVWAEASRTGSKATGDRTGFAWEQGTGVFLGLKAFNASAVPVALEPAALGEIAPRAGEKRTITVWSRSAQPIDARPVVTGFVGPDASGQALTLPAGDGGRLSGAIGNSAVELTAAAARHQGGFYSGVMSLTGPTGGRGAIPLSYTQDVALDFHVDYAYNEFQTNGLEGERVEDASLVLFPGLPSNVGLIGEAFKNLTGSAFKNTGGDLLNSIMVRAGTTRSSFKDASLPASEHGRGRIEAVPPGFYRVHLLSDHSVEGQQARGRAESIGIQLASSGPDAAVVPGSNLLIPSQPVCGEGETGPVNGCVGRSTAEIDPATGMCVARNGSTAVAFNYYCGEMSYAVPTALVSRAVHMIEHAADPTKSEWQTCGVNVPLDGTSVDLGKITNQAKSCQGPTTPSAWSFSNKAPSCLSPQERAANPNGHASDITATYSGLNTTSLRNLPVGVMTYKFRLPALNTYTTGGLALSYAVENALVAVRFQTGEDTGVDASHGLLVVDDPRVKSMPALPGKGRKGSSYNEWAVMSSNAAVGTVSIMVIPTAWTRADLDPTKPIASVQLCDVAMKILTFAKDGWGRAATEGGVPTQFTKMIDRDLLAQIDPSVERVRPAWDGTAFTGAGVEREDLTYAVQIPKNTTKLATAPHHVRSPRGGPAAFKAARTWDGSARGAGLLGTGFKTYDPQYGTTSLACTTGRDAPPAANFDKDHPTGDSLCRLWQAARANGEILGEVAPDTSVNGRFSGLLAVDHATLSSAAGDVAFEIADADDGGAFDAAKRWAVSNGSYVKRLPVSTFYDEMSPLSLTLLGGVLQVVKDGSATVLRMTGGGPGGATHTVSATLG